ncbi:unnamed protein product, partial [Meganyctiphanes norvegica]
EVRFAPPPPHAPSLRNSPVYMSVMKTALLKKFSSRDKNKKFGGPTRPNFLSLKKSGVNDMRSPVSMLTSPGTPTTPIREHPADILSPVTESSTILKSIYNTTSRVTQGPYGEKNVTPELRSGESNPMLKTYITERAVLDATIKMQQYKNSSSENSPDSPNDLLGNVTNNNTARKIESTSHQTKQQQQQLQVHVDESKQLQQQQQIKQEVNQQISQMNSVLDSTSSPNITVNNNMATANSRMPGGQAANFTVMNNGEIDTKTSFLIPTVVGPPTQPRLSHEDSKPKCTICKKEFNRPSQLNLHMNIHYLERPYRCDACAVSFRTNGHLQKHKRSASHFSKVNMNMTFGTPSMENPRPFKCHDCKIAFRIHGHLAKHLRSKMHIMKLECLGKLPFGTYAEIERSGANLNEIDTTDCDNSLESLQVMASRLYEKDPSKIMAWQSEQEAQRQQQRVRTVSNSSTNSDDYPLQDDQDDPLGCRTNDDDTDYEEKNDSMTREGRLGTVSPFPRDSSTLYPSNLVLGLTSRETANLAKKSHDGYIDILNVSGICIEPSTSCVSYRYS